ncbi:MAG: hypothetical protein KJ831_08935, partial [Candidatus Eisenbacteria bacterium]|nr:hypothetical protein [Candidatus Eisenbacteria bacterium]
MLEIRKEQMEVFEKDMRRRIKQRTMMDLRRERPAEFEKRGEEHFRELIEVAEGRIDQFDGDLYKDLHRYILLMLDLGL